MSWLWLTQFGELLLDGKMKVGRVLLWGSVLMCVSIHSLDCEPKKNA